RAIADPAETARGQLGTDTGHEQVGPAVSTFTEWDPLEEVIVGTLQGATVPEWHVQLESTMPTSQWDFYKARGGQTFPTDEIEAAEENLSEFVDLLERWGVRVRRPEPLAFNVPYGTPEWRCAGGLYSAMPRDVLLVVGDEIIEAPMSWRSRY